MKKDLLVSFLLFIAAAVIAAAGCVQTPATTDPQQNRSFFALSHAASIDNVRYVASGGAGLMVVGIVLTAFGRVKTGAILGIGGAAMAAYYMLLSEMLWVFVIMAALAALLWCLWLWQSGRYKWTLKETVAAIQPHGEIKAEICGGDKDKQAKMRKIVDPLKAELRREDRI